MIDEIINEIDKKSLNELQSVDYLIGLMDENEIIKNSILLKIQKRMRENGATKDELSNFCKLVKGIEKISNETDGGNKPSFGLCVDERGKILTTVDNFLTILKNDKKFENVRYNILSNIPEKIVNGYYVQWNDADDSEARMYIEQKYKIHSKDKLDDALRIYFKEKSYHPILEILKVAKWDGIDRIENFFIKWMKCEDSAYTREVSRLIFAGGINRIFKPGCKFDDVAVLIGTNQGEGKSSIIRWLALDDRFFTEVTEFDGQKGIEAIEGKWICEVAELLALTKSKEVEAVKSYITKQADKYRKPFERHTCEVPRQCIFVGSTNRETFLTDKTGNRRFYPLRVFSNGFEIHRNEKIIRDEILQCWAEAKEKLNTEFMRPCVNFDLLEIVKQKQKEAVEDDYRIGMIEEYIKDKERVCIIELWTDALKNEFTRPTRKDSNDISLILQSLGGWERGAFAERGKFGVQKYWYRENSVTEELPF